MKELAPSEEEDDEEEEADQQEGQVGEDAGPGEQQDAEPVEEQDVEETTCIKNSSTGWPRPPSEGKVAPKEARTQQRSKNSNKEVLYITWGCEPIWLMFQVFELV